MKQYNIEILAFPQSFTVKANSEQQAIVEAKKRFIEANNGKSVYAVDSVEVDTAFEDFSE